MTGHPICARLFCVVWIALGAAPAMAGPPDHATGAVAIDPDMAEALFRYLFAHNESARQNHVAAYCLAYGGQAAGTAQDRDPPADFIARFHDVMPPVKAASQCRSSVQTGVIDRKTAQPGLMFRLDNWRCRGPSSCTVSAGYNEGFLSASGNFYILQKNGSQKSGQAWSVVRMVPGWIS